MPKIVVLMSFIWDEGIGSCSLTNQAHKIRTKMEEG
jgi:hypothetical protein